MARITAGWVNPSESNQPKPLSDGQLNTLYELRRDVETLTSDRREMLTYIQLLESTLRARGVKFKKQDFGPLVTQR